MHVNFTTIPVEVPQFVFDFILSDSSCCIDYLNSFDLEHIF